MLIKLPLLSHALAPHFPRQEVPSNVSSIANTPVASKPQQISTPISTAIESSAVASSVIESLPVVSTDAILTTIQSETSPTTVESAEPPSLPTPPASSVPAPSAPEPSPPPSSGPPSPAPSTLVTVAGPSFVEPSPIAAPTILPCQDPSWTPSPDNWKAENVDQKLRDAESNWAGDTSFVDYIASLTGQHGQSCGIGHIGTCTAPDCNALQASGGPKWAYFVSVSIVEMNTFLNIIHNGIDSGKSDLSLTVGQMTNDFFHFQPKPTHANIFPWIGALLTTVLSIVPLALGPEFGILGASIGSAIGASASAFITGGLSEIAPFSDDPHTFYEGTMQQLGDTLKDISFNTTEALDKWSQTSLAGKPDPSGKTIVDYFGGGRFTVKYDLSVSAMEKFYFQSMVSSVVNEQWKSPNATTRQFVMCSNGTAPCNERTLYTEDGRSCCLYSLAPDGKYGELAALDAIGNSTFDIPASNITAGSLHSYLAQGINYTLSTDNDTRIEQSLGTNTTTQAFNQGVSFQGTWTIPVCDVGSNTNWVNNYDSAGMPCCCGPKGSDGTTCTQTNDFIYAAHLVHYGKFYDDCKKQYPGFVGPAGKSAAVRVKALSWWMALLMTSVMIALI